MFLALDIVKLLDALVPDAYVLCSCSINLDLAFNFHLYFSAVPCSFYLFGVGLEITLVTASLPYSQHVS